MAAAIKSKSKFIITRNLMDFPNNYLKQFGITAIVLDDFNSNLILEFPDLCLIALENLLVSKRKSKLKAGEYLKIVELIGLAKTSIAFNKVIQNID